MAALVSLVMCDLWQISGGVIPARMGRKVFSIGLMQPVTMCMVSLMLESSLGA